MNRKILFVEAVLALALVLGFRLAGHDSRQSSDQIIKSRNIIQCSPDWNMINVDSLAGKMVPLPGWGNYRWDIRTKNDSAQFYFQQGINMYYAFHIIESMGSFRKALLFENDHPMIYWAIALAYGPNINDFEYKASPEALDAAKKAMLFSSAAGSREKALIEAMQGRYSEDSTISRTSLNENYTRAMEKVYKLFPGDADVATLYADANMLQHPWDYWKHNGEAQPWTSEILQVLEKSLIHAPQHPGTNHYYIHMVEASPDPGRALASADRLGKLMPSVSHMIHMPSHIYIRTGNYSKGIAVNEASIAGYNAYLHLFSEVQNNAPLYLIHNLHMQTACAMMKPGYGYSIKSAMETSNSFDTSFLSLPQPIANFIQYVYMSPQFVQVRYGKWENILSSADINPSYIYANVLSHWAKGMALANTNKLSKARERLDKMRDAMKAPDLAIVMLPFNAAIAPSKVAEKILEGTIAQKQYRLDDACRYFREAVRLEDSLIYTEPRDWLLPTRQYLANAYLLQKNYKEAKKTLEEDLLINPNNFFALYGLKMALKGLKMKKEAAIIEKVFSQAYINADLKSAALIY
ncbi:MAG TPA: hypothetical protein VK498_00410 [Ferruginibacter sp.]|nr:hypothetical protein [Ferruginibacter sp.]